MGTRFEWFRKCLEKSFRTIVDSGIRPQVMNTMPIFALIAQFYYENPDASVSDANRNAVFHFISKGLLLNQSYRVLTYGKARNWMRYLHRWEPTEGEPIVFPGDELYENENLSPSRDDIQRAVLNTRYSGKAGEPVFTDKNAVAVLGLIEESYTTSTIRDISDYQVDHIFPKSKAEELERTSGEEVDVDKIGNLQLLPQAVNQEDKRDQWPHEWMNTLGNSEKERLKRVNLYPPVEPKPENANDFIEARQEKMIEYFTDKLLD